MEGCMTLLFSQGLMDANMLDMKYVYIYIGMEYMEFICCNICLHGN